MQQVADWLQKLGLGQYAQRFAENDISLIILPHLTDQDLEKIGVASVGHRRQLMLAIAELKDIQKGAAQPPSGAPVAPIAPRDTAERRQVTVMFSDLVGSTALSARMDPEDLREVISAYQKCVAETMGRFGGFVAKYMGDGVLVYFGYPQAHEDDAERAVRAGLELIEVVGKLKSTAPLQTRVGVATGLVVVGDLIGSGEAQERGIVGETPNVAARLQGVAEPNNVVIAEGTRKLLGNLFELQDLGAKEIKGIAEPVHAWAALRASSVESRFEALRAATIPLVGRDEEVGLLMRLWEQAKAGNGQTALISGEPGIGKSRIAETIVERLSVEPHTRLRYFCSPHHQDSALHPSIAQLERAAGFRREDTTEQRLAKLETVLAQGTNALHQVVPLLADLLSIPTGDRYPHLDLTPQKRKERTLYAQLAQVEGLAARQPVLMVWEDVHWSDPTTRESLDLLIDRMPTLRALVIITFRPEFTPPRIGRPHVTTLTLNRLPRRQGAEMIAYVTGGKALPKEISDQIVDRTDGVPLFIEELTKTIVESGIVAEAGDHYVLKGPVTALTIPTSLHASLLARLDRLAPVREVAQIAAALGRQFLHELISAVAGMPQQQLDDALDQLVASELMFRRGTPPDAEYTSSVISLIVVLPAHMPHRIDHASVVLIDLFAPHAGQFCLRCQRS
jgi:class 3 adenylate cyclase